MRKISLTKGFTLIELMIVLVIVAILAAIAYPSYVQYVTKSKRTQAESCLMELSQYMGRLYASNSSYLVGGAAPTLPSLTCQSTLTGDYTIGFAPAASGTTPNPSATTFTLQAVPQGVQLTRDTQCGTLGIDQAGARTETGSGTVVDCW
ncbi:MAG: type IV pilin protein [Porticoccaceae bacterium]